MNNERTKGIANESSKETNGGALVTTHLTAGSFWVQSSFGDFLYRICMYFSRLHEFSQCTKAFLYSKDLRVYVIAWNCVGLCVSAVTELLRREHFYCRSFTFVWPPHPATIRQLTPDERAVAWVSGWSLQVFNQRLNNLTSKVLKTTDWLSLPRPNKLTLVCPDPQQASSHW